MKREYNANKPKNAYSTKELAELTGQTPLKVWQDIQAGILKIILMNGCEKPFWIKKRTGDAYIKKYSLLKLNMPVIRSGDKQFLTVFWRYAIVEILSFRRWEEDMIPKICDYLNINRKQFLGIFYRSKKFFQTETNIIEILNKIEFDGNEITNDFINFTRRKNANK